MPSGEWNLGWSLGELGWVNFDAASNENLR